MEALPIPRTVNGLPFHPLIVHAVVVLIPLAVVGAIGISLWPAMRRHLGLLVLATAAVGLVLVPVATNSGEQFRDRLGVAALVRQHQHYAEQLLPWSAALVVLLALTMAVDIARRLGPAMASAARPLPEAIPEPLSVDSPGGVAVATPPQAPAAAPAVTRLDRQLGRLLPAQVRSATLALRRLQPILAVLTIAVALVLVWYCYKTGDSGAKVVWKGR